ncbi:MAG: hypothetical protein HY905_16700 [Deltaproteobacteria bacterium]|nr:hypothetical protein [Deltaproteobacteria bacterium]
MRVLRTGFVAVVILAAGVVCGSCNTPTLPIPPPIVEALEAPLDGWVDVKVRHENDYDEAVYFLVFNQRTGLSYGGPRTAADPDYAFIVRAEAIDGDCLIGYFEMAPGEVGQGSTCIPWAP